jgi:hypothetical protein
MYDPSMHEFIPEGPPIFPKFPQDVLYPFYIESSASGASASLSVLLALCAVFLLLN